MSIRNDGAGLPDLIGHYLGTAARHVSTFFILLLMLLVGTVFVKGPAMLLVELLPEPEAVGLLALMLLQESRRVARTSPAGDLILLGGDYRPQSRSLVGSLTCASVHSIFSSITVLGINGVSIKRGCTTAVQLETSVNKAMIENSSDRIVVVADHSKMNCVSSFLTCPLDRVDLLVTDWMAPLAFCDELKAAGLNVVRVPEE